MAKNLLLALVAILLALALGEGVARTLGLAPPIHRIETGEDDLPYTRCENPVMGYEMVANHRRDPSLEKPPAGADFYCDRTNAYGLRDVERSVEKPSGRKRILLLGDSVVVGHGIWDLEDTISRNMERELAGEGFEVLNFGIGGYNTRSEAELLKEKGVQFSPDLVVLIILENDFLPYNTQMWKYRYERPRLVELLFVHSDLFRTFSLATNIFHFREQLDPQRYRVEQNELAMKSEFTTTVESGFHLIDELRREHGFEVAVFTWPSFSETDVIDEPFHDVVARLAEPYGFGVFRLAPYFLGEYKELRRGAASSSGRLGPVYAVFTVGDGMHPNERGTAVAAHAIASTLRARGYLG
jgi:lysophospholipase L1-like esterase